MKTNNTNLLAALGENTIQELAKTVKETVAVNLENTNMKTFSVADLWRIQSNRRVRTIRRLVA